MEKKKENSNVNQELVEEISNISEDGKKHEHNQEEYERLIKEQKNFQ